MSDLVREFLQRSMIAAGGIVDDAPGGIDVLLPAEAARELGADEAMRVHLASSEPAQDDVVDGRIGSPFLERLVAARLDRPAAAAVVLPAGLPASSPSDQPVLLNAVRVAAPDRLRTTARFLDAHLRLSLHGEDVRSLLVTVTLRLDDGARTQPFLVSGAYPIAASPLDDRERENVERGLRSWLWREGPVAHAVALDTVRRRARRDLERMADYYASLDVEMSKATQRARAPDERARRAAKWAALPADLEHRRAQLRARIRPRLSARLVAATLIETDLERFVTPVRRRTREGAVAIYHRTADGKLEGPACAACGVATLSFYLCDDRLHVLCSSCGQSGRLDPARCHACRGDIMEPPRLSVVDATARLSIGAASWTTSRASSTARGSEG